MKEIFRDSKDNLNRQLFGDGTGKMATITQAEASAATTFKVDNTKYFAPNQIIDIIKVADGTVLKSKELVKNVDDEALTITVDSATTCSQNDYIVTSGSKGLEITGLGAIMTPDNTIYGVDRSANKWFNPNVFTCSESVLLDDDMMEKCIQRVDLKAGAKPELILSGYTAFRVLKNYLAQYQRYTTMETRYDAGHVTMSYDGIPVEQDKYQGENTMDFLNMKDNFELLSIGQLFDWMNEDGSILKAVSGKAIYEAILVNFAEMMCKHPAANARIKGIVA